MKTRQQPEVTRIDSRLPDGVEAQVQLLAQRLESGYRMISEAISEGRDVRLWEERWLELLHDYESAFQIRQQAA